MPFEYDLAKNKLQALADRYRQLNCQNEAEVRFQYIDQLLVDCLGWERNLVRVERYENGDFTDYELGDPRGLILEAKRDHKYFEIPTRKNAKLITSIRSICDLSRSAKEAIEQVQRYCSSRGVRLAAVCNGPQLIAFIGSRHDGKSPLDGTALVIDGFEEMLKNFAKVYECLSPRGVASSKLASFLDENGIFGIPEKISTFIRNYPSFRYQTNSASQLRLIAELLLEDAIRTEDVEKQFYKECYCESGALAQDALISKNLLRARYAALFDPSEASPLLSPAKPKGGAAISPEILAEGLSRRPIILIGDVGVGKTSFIKNLILVLAEKEFKESIYLYLDLGVNVVLENSIENYVHRAIQDQLEKKYDIDISSLMFTSSLYKDDIAKFERGNFGPLKESDPSMYQLKLSEMLEDKVKLVEQHLRCSFQKISKEFRKQVVIIIDNIDQRDLDLQQKAFIISQSIAQHWGAVVFLAVRPNTFHESKRSGSLSAYPNKIFYIMPPRPEQVLERRIVFALNMAEGRLPIESISSVSLNLTEISLFFKALLLALRKNPQVSEFLSNITGGNVRSMIDFVTKFIGSPNVDSDKIIGHMKEGDGYIIPVHEFSKAALLGDYAHYEPGSSLAINLFDVRYPDRREHFLCALILGYLNYDPTHGRSDGFVRIQDLLSEIQSQGFFKEQAGSALRRLTNKRLIETSQRVTFEETTGVELLGELPEFFRITTVGAYHLTRWCGTFAYIDAMVFDTPIFDAEYRKSCSAQLESFEIAHRHSRSIYFRNYLTETWNTSGISVPYFNWNTVCNQSQSTFDSVENFIKSGAKNCRAKQRP